jgi:uncharacterized protein (DUF305 family)
MYIVLLAVLAGACSSATTGTSTSAPAASPTANEEFEALYRARQDSARMHFTEADVRFMNGMVHHHAQALEMARLVPDRTQTSSIRILAARITNSQRDEIALMQEWLRRRNQTVPELHEMESGVMVHGGDHGGHMPGMLTAAQLAELAAARGPEFDRLFLTYMIQHHEGAVTMVHDLFGTDGAAQDEDAFRLASDVQVDQITEINRMKLMLSEMSPGGANP